MGPVPLPSRPVETPGPTVLVVDETGATVLQNDAGEGAEPTWRIDRQHDRETFDEQADSLVAAIDPDYGEFRVSVDIDAPVADVFEYIADIETHAEYTDFVERVDILSEQTSGVGTVFTQVHTGSPDQYESTFVTFEENERLQWVVEKESNLYINYWFHELEDATRIVHTGISPDYTDADTLQRTFENNRLEMRTLRDRFASA